MAGRIGKLGCRAVHRALTVLVPLAIFCAYVEQPVRPVSHIAVTPTAEIVSAPSSIGIADSSLYGMSQENIDATLDMLQAMGVDNVRVFIPWIYTEPLQGKYNWAPIDAIMDAAKARNMGVLAMVNSTPPWAGIDGNFPGANTPDPAAYASFMNLVATRYSSTVSAYEVWNEVNCNCFYDPVSPASYTQLLQAAYPVIKAADPTATVIAAGLSSVFSAGNVTMNPVDYVAQMYAAGAKGSFDALAIHPYHESLMFSDGQGTLLAPYTQIQHIHALMEAFGDGAKKIWITEYGVPTDHVSQQTQADYIKNLIETWQTMSTDGVNYAGPLFIYTTRDGQPGSGYFGIFDANWIPKEAAFVIAQEILQLNGIDLGDAERRLGAIVRLAVGAVVNVAVNIGQAVVKVVDAAWNAFVDVTKAVTQAVVNTIKWVTNAVFQGVKWVANTAVDITQAVVAGISNVIQKIGDIIHPPAPGAAANPMAALKAVAAMNDVAVAAGSPKGAAAAKPEPAASEAGLKVAPSKGAEAKDTADPDAVKGPAKESADSPEVKTPETKDAVKAAPDDTKPASKKKDPAESTKDQPKSQAPKQSDAPKRDKGKESGQHATGGDKQSAPSGAGKPRNGDTPNDAQKVKPAKAQSAQ